MKVEPTLFIGLGGTGLYAVSELKKTISRKYLNGSSNFPLISYLCIDTEFLGVDTIKKKNNFGHDLDFELNYNSEDITETERIETTVIPSEIQNILNDPQEYNLDDFIHPDSKKHIEAGGDGASGIG
jgi:hypothetical protein